jgi:hypothetical protein
MRANLRHFNPPNNQTTPYFLNTLKKAKNSLKRHFTYPLNVSKSGFIIQNTQKSFKALINSILTKNSVSNRLVFQLRFVSMIETK